VNDRASSGPDRRPDTPGATAATAQTRGAESGASDHAQRMTGANASDDASDAIAFRLGGRIRRSAEIPHFDRKPEDPIYRPLKIYTIDPSRHREEGQTAEINISFEPLRNGPKGFRFAVKKTDDGPLGKYEDVDLDDPDLLMNGGRDPAPTDPVFHHQMVYAVSMTTYAAFRTALGRQVSWAFPGNRLNLVPHAFAGANAFYDRESKTLKFGWYEVKASEDVDLPPGAVVYACLSHDIIAHELTHALLDGMRGRFDRTNGDVGAFHEAFADLIALLLRFSYPTVVQDIILRTKGDLRKDDDWLRFVFELAEGQGERSLREIDLEGKQKYQPSGEEHDRGTVLVSAIVDAFVCIYSRKAAPMFHLATDGREHLADDEAMTAELGAQLTHIASRLASHLLTICIRAIDYCPPVDITLGEYLRALITADRDLVPDDPWAYREAFVDAFRKRHIFPGGVRALSEDALLWDQPKDPIFVPELNFGNLRFAGDPARAASADEARRQARLIGEAACSQAHLADFGLADPDDRSAYQGDIVEAPIVESVRSSRRVGPDGQISFDLVAEVIQCRQVRRPGDPEFTFSGGSTLILGPEGQVRYVIAKNIKNEDRLNRQRQFVLDTGGVVYPLAACRYQRTEASAPEHAGKGAP
jgi:hypothetical protein